MPDQPQPPARWAPGTVLAAGVAFGMAGGALEALSQGFRKIALHRLLAYGNDFVWMAPLADAIIFALIALLLLALSLILNRLRHPRVVVALFGTLAAFAPLLIAERIHKAAALVLAAGLGVSLARRVAGDGAGLARLLRRGAIGGLMTVGALGAAMVALRNRPSPAPSGPSPADRPNILLLVLDTVRAWDIGWMGYWRETTPKLNGWVRQGLVFERMLSTSPWTTPSHAAMFTGHWPTEVSASWTTRLDDRQPTVAELLRAQGYATGGFVANYRYAGSASGLDRGFERYVDYPVNLEQVLRSAQITARLFSLPGVAEYLGARRLIHGGAPASQVSRAFLDWVDRKGERPFFAFINYFEGHAPYLPPAPWDSLFSRGADQDRASRYWEGINRLYGFPYFPQAFLQETKDAYNGSIAYLDFQIDSLLGALRSRGLLDNTVVIITSDHGEHFGEHGLIQHGSSLYLQVLHVPFAMWGPGRVPAGARVADATSLHHLATTLLELGGVTDPRVPGRSLMEYARSPGLVRRDTLFAAVDWHRQLPSWPPNQPLLRGDMRTVILDSLQLIRNGDGVDELFQLGRDPWQLKNLLAAPEFAPALGAYRGALEAIAGGESERRGGGQ